MRNLWLETSLDVEAEAASKELPPSQVPPSVLPDPNSHPTSAPPVTPVAQEAEWTTHYVHPDRMDKVPEPTSSPASMPASFTRSWASASAAAKPAPSSVSGLAPAGVWDAPEQHVEWVCTGKCGKRWRLRQDVPCFSKGTGKPWCHPEGCQGTPPLYSAPRGTSCKEMERLPVAASRNNPQSGTASVSSTAHCQVANSGNT